MPRLATNSPSCRSLHGTCVVINGRGIFITGKPGVGKSLLAISLLKRGYQLLSDDLTTLEKIDGKLIASCPATIKNWLYVRPFGFINVADTFGKNAIAHTATIDHVIHLQNEALASESRPTITRTKHA